MKRYLSLALLVLFSFSSAQTTIRFTLDWAFQGPQAFMLLARERGYFADEGLIVTIDRGFGSAGTVAQIAGGAYDIGFADINSMMEFNAQNPNEALIAIAVIYNNAPFSILTLANKGISSPADLEGRTLGAPAGDAPRRFFPAFADAVGIDEASIEWMTMEPALREATLIRGQVDAITGFYFTAVLNLLAAGVAEEDIVAFFYSDEGVDVYGNSIMASPAFLEANPDAVRGFLRALTRAWLDTLADPEAAIAAVQNADPLIDTEVELRRLMLAIENNMLTDEVREIGFGAVDPERLERSIATVAEVFGLETVPEASRVFTGDYLSDLESRLPPQ